MSYAPFRVIIAHVDGAVFDGDVRLATVPSVEGVATILAHHEPLVALLTHGTIHLETDSGENKQFPITSGVLEVSHNTATILL